jgi:regulator of CtrA degradation
LNAPTAYFNRTYDETMSLLLETRGYVARSGDGRAGDVPPYQRLMVSYESMRVTSRLTQIMAWLLARKAVHAGELSAEEAMAEDYALAGGSICSDPHGPDNDALPRELRSLLERSHSLYVRIQRLDNLVRQSVVAGGVGVA